MKRILPIAFLATLIIASIGPFVIARPLVGVIRYNQFYNPSDADLTTLSPDKWHDRIPWCLDMASNRVSGTCDSQAEFDKDMEYAITAGIDYFAHLINRNDQIKPVQYHLASQYKDQVKFTIIIHQWNQNNWDSRVDSLVYWFQDPSYLKVLNGRPVVYIFNPYDLKNFFGSETKAKIDLIRTRAQQAGLANPYIVSMRPSGESSQVSEFGIDAFSAYMFTGTGLTNYQGYPFVETLNRNIAVWDSHLTYDYIPQATIGNDQRPRWEIPPPWGAFANPWFEQPTSGEINQLVGSALDWVEQHPGIARANSIIIYAWDEVAEGGWLMPTHSEGDSRVRALGSLLSGSSQTGYCGDGTCTGSESPQNCPSDCVVCDTQDYETTFPLTENPISDGGIWLNGRTDGIDWYNVRTNGAVGYAYGEITTGEYTDPTAVLKGAWSPDQGAEGIVHLADPGITTCYPEVEIRLRSDISPHSITGYEVFWSLKADVKYVAIVRWNGPLGDWDYVKVLYGDQYALHDGDHVKATILGNVIKGYQNGVEVISATDDTFSTGNPGMGFDYGCGSRNVDFGFSSFSAYSLSECNQYPSLDKSLWTLLYADSEETSSEDGAAANAFDSDPSTIWHTSWSGDPDPPYPHDIQIDLGAQYTVSGFSYLPRQDGSDYGTIKGYGIYVSDDPSSWGSPAASGEFAADTSLKQVTFSPKVGRYVRLSALSEMSGRAWASAAEIGVSGEPYSEEGTYTALRAPSPPSIDGNPSEFANANPITLTNSRGSSATYRLLWDDAALYISARAQDDQLSYAYSRRDGPLWNDDSIEMMLDTLNDGGQYIGPGDYKFFVNIANVQRDRDYSGANWNMTFYSAVSTAGTLNTTGDIDTGYSMEIAIPWSGWGVPVPSPGDSFGFELVMDDRDDPGASEGTIWANINNNPALVNSPDNWGNLVFSSETAAHAHRADASGDGCVDEPELMAFIGRFYLDSTAYPIGELMEAVGLWKAGTGC